MRSLLVLSFLAAALFSTLSFAAPKLDCKTIEKYDEEEEGYFVDVKENSPAKGKYRSALLRKSVGAFYFQEDLSGKTDKEIDEMAEGVGFTLVKGRNGVEYHAVNVGFGGGNSATYYYLKDTLDFLPLFSYDGDCTEQGRVEEFPIEKKVENSEKRTVACTFGEGSAFETATVEYSVSAEGEFYGALGKLTLNGEREVVKGLKLAKEDEVSLPQHLSAGLSKKGPALGTHIGLKGKVGEQKWTAELTYRFVGDKARFSTTVYPNIAGGRWSKQTVDVDGDSASCYGAVDFSKVVYYRIIGQK